MKKITKIFSLALVMAALCMVQTTVAQVSKSTKTIGGSVSFRMGSGNDHITIVPDFSFFINQDLAIGGRVGFTYNELDDPDVNPVVNAYIRKYKFINDKFAFYGEGFLQYSPSNAYGPYNFGDFAFGVVPGVTYFLDEKFALELNFGGLIISSDLNNNSNVDLFFSPASLFNLGLKYYM